jgi:acetyl esterase
MSEVTALGRPQEPDWLTVTAGELAAYAAAENRVRASGAARVITGTPDVGAAIRWQELALDGRDLPVRVYRPLRGSDDEGAGRDAGQPRTPRGVESAAGECLPLVLHVHGGGFVGTAAQSDWVNSHLAAQLPAVVVSVEHRLLAPDSPLSAAVDDGWDVLQHLVRNAARWHIDPARTVVLGESCGALICALAAVRARDAGLDLRAQILVNPAVDVTGTMLDHPSVTEYARTPTLSVPQLRLVQRLAASPGADPRALSPLYADSLGGLAPALVVVPTHDPLADHGRRYTERLTADGTPARLTEYTGAGHGFLSTPGRAPRAEAAREEILAFVRASVAD